MRQIQMVDLHNQYLRIKDEIDESIQQVLLSSAFIKGKNVKEFENNLQQFTGAGFCIGCGNGTDALQIALMALNLPAGSEIILPSFGYAAIAEVALLLGFNPVFAEVDERTFLLDPSKIESVMGPKTKVIVPVHLYGQTCDMESIIKIARNHNVWVIEDTAQAIGSVYTYSDGRQAQAGTMADIGTTSFFPSKNLGCYGDGGAVFTNNPVFAETIAMVANHGQKIKYKHEIVGINSRLDTIQAAILNVKLKYLPEFEKARRSCADFYDRELANIPDLAAPLRAQNSSHVFHQYTLTLKNETQRNALKKHLEEASIPTMIYYPTPLHQQQAYYQNISMPLTEDLCKRVLSLPIHTEMEQDQLIYITGEIKKYFNL